MQRTSADLEVGDAFVIKEPLKAHPLNISGYACGDPIHVETIWVFKAKLVKHFLQHNILIDFVNIVTGEAYYYIGTNFELE